MPFERCKFRRTKKIKTIIDLINELEIEIIRVRTLAIEKVVIWEKLIPKIIIITRNSTIARGL